MDLSMKYAVLLVTGNPTIAVPLYYRRIIAAISCSLKLLTGLFSNIDKLKLKYLCC